MRSRKGRSHACSLMALMPASQTAAVDDHPLVLSTSLVPSFPGQQLRVTFRPRGHNKLLQVLQRRITAWAWHQTLVVALPLCLY